MLTIILMIGLFAMQTLNAQTMVDSEIVYDENFNPIVKICLDNDTQSKTITTVEVTIQYGTSNSDDFLRKDYKKYTKFIQITPLRSQWFSITVAKTSNNYPPQHFFVSRVRYSDGTIWEHEIVKRSGGLL